MTAPVRPRRRHLLLAAVAVGALAVAIGAQRAGIGGYVTRCVTFFRDAGAWPFFLAMTVLPAFGFPVLPFTVAAGPVFGPTLGVGPVIACALLAVTINLTACYWLAARALRPLVERLARRFAWTLPELPRDAAWEIALVARIVPGAPFCVQNYLLGIARVPFGTYVLVSVLVQGVFIAGTILTGDALMRGDPLALVFGGAVCVAAGVAIYRLRKRFAAAPRAA